MVKTSIKKDATQLIENLHENSSWDDLMYKIYVRQSIDTGLLDSQNGKTVDVKDVRKIFGLI